MPAALALLVALLLLPGCSPEAGAPSGSGGSTPLVVASVFPVGDLLERIAGGAARVHVVLPAATSPSVFQPTPAQMRRIAGAALYVEVGAGLDAWLRPVAAEAGAARVLTLTRGMELRGEGHEPGSGNPHVWLDPVLVRDRLLPAMTGALVDVAPGAETGIRARAGVLADSLTVLHEEVAALLAPHRGAAFVASHAAWTYFAERYGLAELAPIHPGPGSEPSSRGLAALVDSARARRVRAVFAEPQLGETAARALATELRVPVRILDPLGGEGMEGRDTYERLIRYNAETLADALGRRPEEAAP